jgi:heme-degrading monooxygenase HmoA
MAIKIIIRRRVQKEKEGKLLPLLVELRSKATTQPGYISGETMRNVNDPQDFIVISTWQSVEAWEGWEASKGREEIQKKIDALLGEKTVYGVYFYGSEAQNMTTPTFTRLLG